MRRVVPCIVIVILTAFFLFSAQPAMAAWRGLCADATTDNGENWAVRIGNRTVITDDTTPAIIM